MPRPAAASGSSTQPAWATVDQASSRMATRWVSATRLPTVMVTTASTATAGAQVPASAGRPMPSSTTSAAAPATLETTERKAATGSGAPA